jgi:hypothetical protein
VASQPDAQIAKREMAKAATSDSRWAASVKIARLFALIPPATSTAMKTAQSMTETHNFFIEAARSLASLELLSASLNPHGAPLQALLDATLIAVVSEISTVWL